MLVSMEELHIDKYKISFDKSYSPSRKNQFSDLKNFNGQSSTAPFKKVKSYVKFASEPNEYLLTEHWKNFKNKNYN